MRCSVKHCDSLQVVLYVVYKLGSVEQAAQRRQSWMLEALCEQLLDALDAGED